jgi:hypothetical protein
MEEAGDRPREMPASRYFKPFVTSLNATGERNSILPLY